MMLLNGSVITSEAFVDTSQIPQKSTLKRIFPTETSWYKWEIVWANVILLLYLHIGFLYGLYLWIFVCTWKTHFWAWICALAVAQGVTAGVHRLWAHRSYKAKLPLRVILMVLQTLALETDIYDWVRDHRVHHKFTDTDADPHNAKRGFFFSHIGWLMVRKNEDVKIKGKTIDLSDLEADPVVRFQRKYYIPLALLCLVTSAAIPWYFWGDSWWTCWYVVVVGRNTVTLNGTWLVNSAAHLWGTKPYDRSIAPTENTFTSVVTFGEGWHNYHHVFSWDYKASELGQYNPTTKFINLFVKIGWAYDLKTVPSDMIKKRVERTGDGTRVFGGDQLKTLNTEDQRFEGIWGWGDTDMKVEDVLNVKIYNKLKD